MILAVRKLAQLGPEEGPDLFLLREGQPDPRLSDIAPDLILLLSRGFDAVRVFLCRGPFTRLKILRLRLKRLYFAK